MEVTQDLTEIQRKFYNYCLIAIQGHCITIKDLKVVVNLLMETMEESAILNHIADDPRPLDDMI